MKNPLTLIPIGAALAGAIAIGTAYAAAPLAPGNAPAAVADDADAPPAPDHSGRRDGHGPQHGDAHFRSRGFDRFGFMPGGEGPGSGLMRELHGLGLSEAQRDNIDDIVDKHHQEQRELFKRGRSLHRAYRDLDPTAKDYVSQSGKLADQTAALTRDALKLRARIDSEIVATLTPEQTQQLQARIADSKARRDERRDGRAGP
ncbi:Spy/CpxP family protein refolding chaperone [Solimonas soli]|uniref:Spy/CpxP family protein refolding chaperone n=1 Tax=Solimonas soli TaxID=413479 RepID=UPI0004862E2C|nr:Spy/CpxP family protein refolding chaperone [Solimonas soli]